MTGVKKDKNAPKRPCSGYILFCNDYREEVRRKNPELKFSELSSYLSGMWKEASEKIRNKYNEKSEKDRERYHQEMKEYVPPKKEETEKKEKKEKKDKPKRNPSGYILYCNSVREKVRKNNPSFGPKEVTKRLAEMWNNLNEKDKMVFNEKSKNFVRKDEESSQDKKSKRKEVDLEPEVKKKDKKKDKKKKEESESEEEVEYYEEYYTDDD
jgi:hypothetical protein